VSCGVRYSGGTLSNDSAGSEPVTLGEGEPARIIQSQGRDLISGYWGRYVVILIDATAPVTQIIRDASGHLPCYRARAAGIRFYFSRLSDYSRLGVEPLSVNWEYMAARMVFCGLQGRETGLKGIEELHAGECDAVGSDGTRNEFYWHSLRFCAIASAGRLSGGGASLESNGQSLYLLLGGLLSQCSA
jgi:asparagine synthase (glutamine-hydrolysing)